MKLVVAVITVLSLLASRAAYAQREDASVADALRTTAMPELQKIKIIRSDSQQPSQGPAEHFTGSVRIGRLFVENPPSHTSAASVTFEAGARTAWHSHPLGQTLIVTSRRFSNFSVQHRQC